MNRAAPDADFNEVATPKPSPRSSRARWYILLGLLVSFTALNYLAVSSGSPGEIRDRPIVLTTLATITGPFVGPIARHGQDCCLNFALVLAASFGPVLVLGLIAQVIPLPFRCGQRAVRLVLWTLGWFAWLFSGLVSFAHALF